MKAGNFFVVDETSSSAFGLNVYRYNQIKKEVPEDSSTNYPVYLSISKESVIFFLQYWKSGKEINYQHAKLIELPFSADIDSLKQILVKSYHKDSIINDDEPKSKKDKPRLDSNISYWNNFSEKITDQSINNGTAISHRKLLLDFLFDIQHSQVFSQDKNFPRLRTFLEGNELMSSLIAKAEYYYWKELFESSSLVIKPPLNFFYKSVAEKYVHSSTRWLNQIRSEYAANVFYKSLWFSDDLEEEYVNVYPPKLNQRDSHSLVKAFKKLKDDNIKYKTIEENLYLESSNWFLRRYDLLTAFRCKRMNVQNFLPRLLMAITSVWFIVLITQDLWWVGVNLELDIISGIGICIVISFVAITFFANEIRKLSNRASKRTVFCRSTLVYLWGFAYSFLLGFIVITFVIDPMLLKTDILQNTYKKHISKSNVHDPRHKTLLLYSDIMYEDMGSELSTKQFYNTRFQVDWTDSSGIADSKRHFLAEFDTTKLKPRNHKPESHQIFLNKNKMGLSMSDELVCTFQMYHYLQQKYGEYNIDAVIDQLEERLRMPNEITDQLLYKNMSYLNLNIIYIRKTIYLGMIIIYSFFAPFAGLFFQLFFDDKPVTEPI